MLNSVATTLISQLSQKHTLRNITMDGYQVFRRDREGRMRGGTAVVVADRYKAEEYIIPGDSRELELIWIKIHRPTENIYVGALYHPPKPIYATDLLLKRLETTTEAIISEDPNGLLLLGGDFNMLSEQEVIEHTGLMPLIDKPTRGPNILDKLFVSRPSYTNVKVMDSALKTDHRAIIATEGRVIKSVNKKSRVVQFRKRSPAQHAELLRRLTLYDDGDIQANADPILGWDKFYQDVQLLLDEIYPTKNITLTSADPAYLTPEIKILLRKKNRLMRRGRLEEASALARRIGLKIERANNCNLKKLDSLSGTAELWKEVNKLINKKRQHDESSSLDAEALNLHYAAISHDPQYQSPVKKCTVTKNKSLVTESLMFKMLDSLHHTAEGADGIPARFLRLAAPVLAGPLAHLVNLSLNTATVPKQWKTAVIRPVPKVSQPKVPADYRPISIVPVLARMVERLVVQTYVYPAFQMEEMKHLLSYQYAFRPTGSTTTDVITIMQKVADLLASNKYVTIIALDFSKAFDTVRHHELTKKLTKLAIPDNIYNWLIDTLLDRKHETKFCGLISKIAEINASVVQGSGVGPSEFDVCTSDLHPLHKENLYVKFADDTYLLVGSNMRHTVCEELDRVKKWAELNNLKLNTDKSKEMLIPKSGRWTVPEPPPLGMERVSELKSLEFCSLMTIGVDLGGQPGHAPPIVELVGQMYPFASPNNP